jgi:hypothetical protein
MAFTTCSVATNNIASLDDLPNDVGGLTAAQLKAKFDQFGADFVAWFNATHIAEADAHLADKTQHISGNAVVSAYHSAAQSIADSVYTALAFSINEFNTDNMHDTVINNTRITFKTAGKYLVSAFVPWEAGSGTRIVGFNINGAGGILNPVRSIVSSGLVNQQAVMLYDANVNDYTEVNVYQDSGGAINVAIGARVFAVKVG